MFFLNWNKRKRYSLAPDMINTSPIVHSKGLSYLFLKIIYSLFGQRPGRGRSPVEWGDFLSVRPSVRSFVRLSVRPPVPHSVRQSIRSSLDALGS